MMKFTVTLAANVRAYTTIEIEAADEEAAFERAKAIADSPWAHPGTDMVFNPDYSTLSDIEVLDDLMFDPDEDE
jgi:hypothetical protein